MSAPAASAPVYGTPPQAATGYGAPAAASAYAGFWIRFLAALIDAVVIFVVSMILFVPIGIVLGIAGVAGAAQGGVPDLSFLEGPLMALNWVVSILLQWLYEALLTSSAKQGTLGKMALGLVVTDLNGRRISFARATGRHFGKWASSLLLMIGYLMQPFTAKKQALHDILAGTLVIKRQ